MDLPSNSGSERVAVHALDLGHCAKRHEAGAGIDFLTEPGHGRYGRPSGTGHSFLQLRTKKR